MTGKTLSHHKVIEEIGQGGMGVVYKAEDTRFRNVALKHRLQGRSMQTDELLDLGIQIADAFDAVHSMGIVL